MTFSKRAVRVGSLALLLLSPAAAFAQAAGPPPDGPPPAGTTPNPEQQAAMEAHRAQRERIHQEARTQMLASLTAQHRTQFAEIVGAMAIAPVPDAATAAKQIDALLSVREARAVVATATSERSSERTLMQSAHAQFEASLTPAQKADMEARMQRMKAMHENRPAPVADPGELLLHTALGFEHMHGGPPGTR